VIRFIRLAFAFALAGASVIGAARAQDPLINYQREDREMNAAIAQAGRTLPQFLKALRDGSAAGFFVKAPIPHAGGREHIWVRNVREDGDEFVGEIDNNPVHLTNVRKGSPWRIKQSEISDWYFVRDGLMHGAWTLRVMVKRMSPAEAAAMRRRLAP
jgi:uncharacterized protein YegJ (DUF2314 family)